MISTSLLTCNPATMPNDPAIPNPITTAIGTIWTMQQSGVTLTINAHQDSNTHATIVMAGQVSVVTNTDTTPTTAVTYNPGDVIDFSKAAGVGACTITSTQAGTVFATIVKVGANMSAIATSLATLVSTAQTLESNIAALATVNTGANPTT